ncbi:MAG TPA: aminotransferase class IV [Vicinamibacterales bacterium]|nr:aminotransferase class IV [Vicinamibacterales bacterium]
MSCRTRGADEGVMRSYRGELDECTQSNLCIVKGGRGAEALTPPLDAGILPGISREFVFEVGRGAAAAGPITRLLLGRFRARADEMSREPVRPT